MRPLEVAVWLGSPDCTTDTLTAQRMYYRMNRAQTSNVPLPGQYPPLALKMMIEVFCSIMAWEYVLRNRCCSMPVSYPQTDVGAVCLDIQNSCNSFWPSAALKFLTCLPRTS